MSYIGYIIFFAYDFVVVRSLTLPMGQKRHYKEQLNNYLCQEPDGLSLARFTLQRVGEMQSYSLCPLTTGSFSVVH